MIELSALLYYLINICWRFATVEISSSPFHSSGKFQRGNKLFMKL